jgi:prevent-host-death family protein
MSEVGVHQAKTTLSQLLRRVAAGEEITITRGGKPVARLVPVSASSPRVLGEDQGRYVVPHDFDDPLPDDLLAGFES